MYFEVLWIFQNLLYGSDEEVSMVLETPGFIQIVGDLLKVNEPSLNELLYGVFFNIIATGEDYAKLVFH